MHHLTRPNKIYDSLPYIISSGIGTLPEKVTPGKIEPLHPNKVGNYSVQPMFSTKRRIRLLCIENESVLKRQRLNQIHRAAGLRCLISDEDGVQDLLIRVHCLSMIHGTAPLLSLQRRRVIIEAFQIVPVIMALDMPKVRMLIADDVSLGNTIDSLIVTELLARQRASRLLVVCPANLREQWKEACQHGIVFYTNLVEDKHE